MTLSLPVVRQTCRSVGDKSVNLVGVTSTADLADQLIQRHGLGIAVSYDETNDKLTVTSESGENISFGAQSNVKADLALRALSQQA